MHHPGRPRFAAVGDSVELAPRDPDPAATYAWRLATRPDAAAATLGDAAVEHLVPDAPGRYVAELTAPDGTHRLPVHVFPGHLAPAEAAGGSGFSGASGSARRPPRGRSGGSGSARPVGNSGPGGRPRVRLDAHDAGEALRVTADPRPHPDGTETAGDLDVEFVLDPRDGVAPADVEQAGTTLRVPRDAVEERVRVYGVAVGADGYSVPDAVDVRPTADGLELGRPDAPPDWAGDAVIYEVYLRTFGGSADSGAPFDAVRDRLDYIADLGADVLWLTPVLENDHAPHGYNVTDFFSVAADLGGRDGYERLVEAAHDRGLRVLFDLVLNHSARTHPYFQAAVADPDSEYREWYEWRGPEEPETYFEWEHIANFDFEHLPVRRHLLDAVDEWAPLVDGFRCDMAWAVPDGFWMEVRERVKARDAEFLLLDETIPYVPDFQAGMFDVHFDSTTAFRLREVGRGDAPASAVLDAVAERARVGFPAHAGFMVYCENHDEGRYVVEAGEDAARAAAGALATLPGSPMVYAGQEFGQRGRRDALAWADADESLRAHVRALLHARSEVPALQADATFHRVDRRVESGPDRDRVVAYGRVAPGGDEAAVVVLNFAGEAATVALDAAVEGRDLVTGEDRRTESGVAVADVAVLPADPASVSR